MHKHGVTIVLCGSETPCVPVGQGLGADTPLQQNRHSTLSGTVSAALITSLNMYCREEHTVPYICMVLYMPHCASVFEFMVCVSLAIHVHVCYHLHLLLFNPHYLLVRMPDFERTVYPMCVGVHVVMVIHTMYCKYCRVLPRMSLHISSHREYK